MSGSGHVSDDFTTFLETANEEYKLSNRACTDDGWTSVRCTRGHVFTAEGLPERFGLNGPCPLCQAPIIEIIPHPNERAISQEERMNTLDQARPESNGAYSAADAHIDCEQALDHLWTIERRFPEAKIEVRAARKEIQRVQNWADWVAAG